MKKKNYWWQLIQLFFHFKRKSIELPFYPIRLWIEPTNDCNYACVMCPNKDLQDKGYMEFTLFQKIIDQVKSSTFDINIVHRGESLLHPQIIEMITYAKSHDLYVRMHTNGSLLTEEMAVKILRAGLDQISFSFDGYDKETYEKIRKGGNFDQTFRNIIRFLEIKKEKRSRTPKTAVEVIDFGGKIGKKFRELKTSFLQSFEDLPLENLVIKNSITGLENSAKKNLPRILPSVRFHGMPSLSAGMELWLPALKIFSINIPSETSRIIRSRKFGTDKECRISGKRWLPGISRNSKHALSATGSREKDFSASPRDTSGNSSPNRCLELGGLNCLIIFIPAVADLTAWSAHRNTVFRKRICDD